MTARCQRPRCGRPLRTEESVRRGYGPVCWRRINPAVPHIPAPEHRLDPHQIPLPLEDNVTTTRQPRTFDVDAAEPDDVIFLSTHDGEIVQRLAAGRWSLLGDDSLDWHDIAEHAPLRELITKKPLDRLRDLAVGLIRDHIRDTTNGDIIGYGTADELPFEDLYVLEALLNRAVVDVTVGWPNP